MKTVHKRHGKSRAGDQWVTCTLADLVALLNGDRHHLWPEPPPERRGLGYGLANGMRTTCTHGHEYTPENTYINPQYPTSRRCRTCARERDRTRKAS